MISQTDKQGTPLEVFWTFLKLGLLSFGGPIAHVGYFHRELVEKRAWLNSEQYSQLLAVCQILPGPASSQLGYVLGLFRAGWGGALLAFIGFTLPSAILMFLFAYSVPALGGELGQAVIQGLKLSALIIVADAVVSMFNKLCVDRVTRTIAVVIAALMIGIGSQWMQFAAIFVGGCLGIAFCRFPGASNTRFELALLSKRTGVSCVLIFGLLFGLFLFAGSFSDIMAILGAFYRSGALVFGGGHVVLPLLDDALVQTGRLTEETFLAGYGAAQVVPGPLFTLSAYLGAVIPSAVSPVSLASLCLLCVFLPGFLLVTGALPFWQLIHKSERALRAVAGVNASVVGLLVAALYEPIFTSTVQVSADMAAAVILLGGIMIWKISPLWVVFGCVIFKLVAAQM